MDTTSISLLERLRRPDDGESWKRFSQLYTPILYAWATRAGLGPSDAADLVQDVFVILLQKLPGFQYDRSQSFRGWLRTVTMNKLRDQKRREALAAEIPYDEASLSPLLQRSDQFWEGEYRKELVARALEVMKSEFSPSAWQACWEFVALGTSAAVLREKYGLTENAIYIHKCRIIRRLRQELAGFLD